MKKLLTLISILSIASINSYAQNNIIKLNALGLLLGNISLQDEYSLNGNSSVALGLSYMPDRGVPSSAVSKDPSGNAANLTFGGFSVTPEYRYYFNGEGPKGLYLSAYFRYAKYKTEKYKFTYNTDSGDKDVTLDGDFKTTVFGLMLGSQFLLGDKFTLDWWIIGAGFGSFKGEYTGTGTFSDQDQQDIHDEVGTIDTPGMDVTVTTTSSLVTLTVEPKFPAVRGFGLCVGYRF